MAVSTLALQSEDKYTRQAYQRRQDEIYFFNKNMFEKAQAERRAVQLEIEIEQAERKTAQAERKTAQAEQKTAQAERKTAQIELHLKTVVESLLGMGNTITEIATMMGIPEHEITELLPELE